MLVTAALLGPEFATDVLEELHGADAAIDAIDRARAAGLLAETAPAGARHAFTHALVADALASRPSGLRRARLHGRIGAVLAARAEADPARHAADAARHLVAAGGDPEPAVRWSMVAAARATELLADDEAAGHWRDALAAMPDDDPRRGPALAALGEALTRAGTRGAAQAPFDAAAAAARAARRRRPDGAGGARRRGPRRHHRAGPTRASWACWRRRWRWTPPTPTRCGARACWAAWPWSSTTTTGSAPTP